MVSGPRGPATALLPHVEPGPGVARHGQRDQVRPEPPLTSSPLGVQRVPSSSLHQSSTCSSTRLLGMSRRRSPSSMAAASISAITPIGVPLPITQPQKRGWLLPSW